MSEPRQEEKPDPVEETAVIEGTSNRPRHPVKIDRFDVLRPLAAGSNPGRPISG